MKRRFRQTWMIVTVLALASACGGGGGSGENAKAPDDSDVEGESGGEGSPSEGGGAKGSGLAISAPSEGTKALESRSVEMQFDLTLIKDGSPAGMQAGSWSVYEERTLEVQGTKDKAISKLQLAFGRREAKALLGVEKPSVTAGKTYAVEGEGAEPAVKAPGGKDVPPLERTAVLAEYGWVGSPSPLLTMIADLKPGATTQPPADARRALIGELPGIDHERTNLTVKLVGLEGGDRKVAKLDVKLESELDNGDMSFTLKLAGPAQVDAATGWVKTLELSGEVRAKGSVQHKKKPMEAKGKGTAKIVRKAEFR